MFKKGGKLGTRRWCCTCW